MFISFDLDGDGDLDIVSCFSELTDTIAWYENDGLVQIHLGCSSRVATSADGAQACMSPDIGWRWRFRYSFCFLQYR